MFYSMGQEAAWRKLGFALPPRAPGMAVPQQIVQGRNALQTAAQQMAARKALRTPEQLAALAAQRPKAPLDVINPAVRR